MRAKLTDFGISAVYKEPCYEQNNENMLNQNYVNLVSNFTRVGAVKFVAPEILRHKKGMQNDYDYKVDVFSLGLTMLCLVSNKIPIFKKRCHIHP